MAFPQLDRLQHVREDVGDPHYSPVRAKRWARSNQYVRDTKAPIDELPVDEVFRRINAGEYLE